MNAENYTCVFIAAGMGTRIGNIVKDSPKSFLEIDGKKIIEHHLDNINNLGIKKAIFVVGYQKEQFYNHIGYKYKNVEVEYVDSPDYATTGHGWSTFLSSKAWKKDKTPILFIHADVFADPRILQEALESEHDNILMCDENYKVNTGDECTIRAEENKITGIYFDNKKDQDQMAGELVGINKWSLQFTEQFYSFLEEFFKKNNKKSSYISSSL